MRAKGAVRRYQCIISACGPRGLEGRNEDRAGAGAATGDMTAICELVAARTCHIVPAYQAMSCTE